MRYLVLFLISLYSNFAFAQDAELLEPDVAFKFSARVADEKNIEVRYLIANGYYMYRDKFKFSATPELTLGTPVLPAGKIKQDEFFGRVETYRQAVVIKIPFTAKPGTTGFTLTAISQGCADVGVCYTPQEQKANLQLTSSSSSSSGLPETPKLEGLKKLGLDLGGANEFLPPDEAFKLTLHSPTANSIVAAFTPAPSYYLYKNKINFTLNNTSGSSIKTVTLPKGEMKEDPTFGTTEVYHRPLSAIIELTHAGAPPATLSVTAGYQGCSDKGVCYPPVSKVFTVKLGSGEARGTSPASGTPITELDDASQIDDLLKNKSFWAVVAAFFVIGLGLSLTPCVFPMIPILSGIIVGQGTALTKSRAFALSVAYVLGMAVTYAIAGVIAGLSGTLLSTALQNPWVLSVFALIFVLLAFSMFGFYDLQLPSFIQSKFSDASNKVKGGNLLGVFVMGALSAIIVGPCVAAPLAGALLYIGQTHNVWLGGTALFMMALGMGVPLLLVGASGGMLLPRAGAWMDAIKAFFGVLLLGVAIWLISPVISALAHMLLWAALFMISAIYLKVLEPLPPTAKGFTKFWKGVGVILLVVGTSLLIGALAGNRDILKPLAGLGGGGGTQAEEKSLKFERIKSVAELEQRITAAKGKPVMLDFYADWCVSCKEMERFTFSDPRVHAKLENFVLLQADVTKNNEDDKALLKKFKLFGPPGIIFYDPEGKEIPFRVIGYQNTETFLKSLSRVSP